MTDDERRDRRRLLGRLLPRTLRARLAFPYVVLIVAVIALLGTYLVIAARNLYTDRLSEQLVSQALLVGDAVEPYLADRAGVAVIDPVTKRIGDRIDARVTVIAPDGRVLGDSAADPATMDNHADRPEIIAALRRGVAQRTRTSATVDNEFLYAAVAIDAVPGAVARVAVPRAEIEDAVDQIQRDVALATGLAALLAGAMAIFLAGRIAGPLEDLRRQARAVAGGRFNVAVEPADTRELGDVGRAFNLMTEKLRQSVAEAERTKLRLEGVLRSLSDGVILTDDQGDVIRLNAAAGRMLATSEDAARGRPFLQVARDHELAALLRAALDGSAAPPAAIEHGLNRRTLLTSAQMVQSARERLGLVVMRDTTDVRRLEAVRREFVANVSHELRTPLTSIRALVETLEAGAIDDRPVATDFLARIIAEVDRLATLVDELLDLARLEAGRSPLQLATLDPADLFTGGAERLRPQTERARLALIIEIPDDLPSVRADRTRVEQVLLNLVHNAIKFTPPGGTITVSAAPRDGSLVVSVRDTGVGVPPDELPRLFERFYKADRARRSEGTGLGLAIAKHIVQAHGGTIWAESTVGEGATFHFTLPTSEAGAGHSDVPDR